jgi:Flp pilus assembly protein TadG
MKARDEGMKRKTFGGRKRGIVQRRREAGQTLAFVTFGLLAFLAAAGLAIDMGYLRYERRLMQSAADSAAMAAATDLNLGNAAQADTDALDVAGLNGFNNGVNNTTVTVTDLSATEVQVQVQQILPSFFMKIAGVNNSTIQATATATIAPSNGCIYALQAGGITLNAGVNSPNCGVVDNGPLLGSGNITAASVGVVGDFSGYTGVSSSTIEQITQPAGDPLAYVTPPGIGVCTQTNFAWNAGTTALVAGVYCGGIAISGGSVTFGPGLYILTGAVGLVVSGTGTATDGGAGVTFYNTDRGAISFSGTGTVSFTAPTTGVSGLPAELLFYQDPSDAAAADLSMGGTGNAVLNGALYFPTAPLTIAGSLSPTTNTLVVASSVTVNGAIVLEADSTSLAGPSPLQTVTLLE